jgi:hypothetical protein
MAFPTNRPKRRRVNAKGRSEGVDRFVMLPHYLLKSAAWRSLKPVERGLYVEVAQRFNGSNNGKIGLGQREAGMALHVRPQTAGRAFDRLVETGFLRMTRDSAFNMKNRLAREWAMTDWDIGDVHAPRDFMRWAATVERTKTQMRYSSGEVALRHTVERGEQHMNL